MYIGSWKIDDLVTFACNTHTPSTGAATDADAVPSYRVYEDETGTAILTGNMAKLDDANTVGFYSEQITLSAANGFEKGKSYSIYISATVGGVVGTMSHQLQVEAEVDANVVSDKTGYSLSTPQSFNLIGNITGTLSNVNNVVNPVTVGTNNDKTGYSLSSPQTIDINGTITNVTNVINPVTAGNVTGSVLGNVNGSVNSVTQPVGINTGTFIDALVDRVWDEDVDASHQTAGSAGKNLDDAGAAGDPWGTALPGSYTPGQAGHILASRMPTGTVIVSSNQDKTGYSLSSPQNFNLIGNITGTISTALNVTNPVTVGTNNDKTGYSLSSPQTIDINGTITTVTNVTNPVTAGVVTGSVLGNVNGSVNSVTQPVGINTGSFISAIADGVWDEQLSGHQAAGSAGDALSAAGSAGDPWSTVLPGSYTPGQAGHILASRMPTGTVLVGDKTGFSLLSPQFVDISGTITNVVNVINNVTGSSDPWATALPGAYGAGTAGSIVGTNLDTRVSSRQPSGTVVVSSNQDKTGYSLSSPQTVNFSGTITNVVNVLNQVTVSGSVASVTNPVTVGTNNDKTGYGLATGTLIDSIADQVWNEAISGHLLAGSTGEKLNAAGAAGDPWTTALPGAYGAGTAGHILASRMPTGTVVVGQNNDKTGYSLSDPQSFNLIGNISGTLSRVIDLTNAGSTVIADADMTEIAERVWLSQYAPIRTLTTAAGDSIPPAAGDDVFAVRGDTFVWNISGLDLTNLSKIQFSVKRKPNHADSDSLIFVESGTGLIYIDGSAAQVAANGAITYSQVSGTAQIRVEAVEMAKLDTGNDLPYDIQIIRTTGTIVSSPVQGDFHITWDSTRATS